MAQLILVTGGAGYIGSHTVRALQRAGHRPVVLDNLVYGHRRIAEQVLQVPLVEAQLGNRPLLDDLLSGRHSACAGEPIAAVLHFAAYAYVGESVAHPLKYYRNNLGDTFTLVEALLAEGQRRGSAPPPLVFSSTCAIYGIPDADQLPIAETCPQRPINPYGRSKWMVEQLLADAGAAYGLPSVSFRYFNAAGADPAGDLGEDHTPETHLIPLALEASAGRGPALQIFGTDYPTPDGTAIRDFIHVSDLADAHVLGLEHLLAEGGQHVFNLGTGSGSSVQQVVEAVEAVTGRPVPTQLAPRRPGDPPVLVACAAKARRELGWQPRYPELNAILQHAWSWHQAPHGLVSP